MITVGSLFSGIGGLDLGLERAGMRVKWQVEKDPYARRVLAKHWPRIKCYDDVCRVHDRAARHSGLSTRQYSCDRCLEPVDLLCGGFPCQDISNAGKRAGIKGERSGLWKEFARLISEIQPRWVLVENVPALRSRGLEVVLRDLSESGYDAEWDCIPAAAVGAPHLRDRIFLVAYSQQQQLRKQSGRGSRPQGQGSSISPDDGLAGAVADPDNRGRVRGQKVRGRKPDASGRGDALDAGEGQHPAAQGALRLATEGVAHDQNQVADADADADGERELQPKGRIFNVGRRPSDCGWWATEPDVGRVAHGISARVDRLRCLGNAVVPQVAEHVGRLIVAADRGSR